MLRLYVHCLCCVICRPCQTQCHCAIIECFYLYAWQCCGSNTMEVERNGNFPVVHSLVVRASNNFSESQHPQNIAYVDVIARWAGIQMVTQCHLIRTQEMQFGFTCINPGWPDELSKPHCTLRKSIGNFRPTLLGQTPPWTLPYHQLFKYIFLFHVM
jgi:hypothetical protein